MKKKRQKREPKMEQKMQNIESQPQKFNPKPKNKKNLPYEAKTKKRECSNVICFGGRQE